jgi:hypothetical protein
MGGFMMRSSTACTVLVLLVAGGAVVACSPVSGSASVAASAGSVTTTVRVTTTLTERPTGGPGLGTKRVFDEVLVARGVDDILTSAPPSGYGLTGVREVTCPPDQPVEAGSSFECTLKVKGKDTTVTVLVQDDGGLYQVNPPN